MTILFIGTELDSLSNVYNGDSYVTDPGKWYDSNWARNTLVVQDTSAFFDCTASESVTSEFWFHITQHIDGGFGEIGQFAFIDSLGQPWIRMDVSNTFTNQVQYWNGSSWISIGSTFLVPGPDHTKDIKITGFGGSNVSLDYWVNGVNLASVGNIPVPSMTDLKTVRVMGLSSIGYSQILIADSTTLSRKVKSAPPIADGTDTDGIGSISNVNETQTDDSTYIEFTSAGQHRSAIAAARSFPYSTVKGVSISGRMMRVDNLGPQFVSPYLLINGTRYYGPNFPLYISFTNYSYIWTTNPATGFEWTTADAENSTLEFGWEMGNIPPPMN